MLTAKSKSSLGGTSVKMNPLKSTGSLTVKPKDKPSAVVEVEKPHKSSLKKAKRKAEKLRTGLPTEEQLLAELPRVPPESQEQTQLNEYLHMFRSLRKLIRKAEKACMEERVNSKEYYALCTLYSQMREIIADIRSVSDMSGQVATMESDVIRPLVNAVGQNLLDTMFQIKKVIMDVAAPDKTQSGLLAIEALVNEQGKFLQHQYVTANEKISSILMG